MSKRTKKNLNKYFLPLSLLSALYALSFSFIFFFEGSKLLASVMFATSLASIALAVTSVKVKKEYKNIVHCSYLALFHTGFLFAAVISGGLFSPMIWGQLIIAPMAYKFISSKKLAHFLSIMVFTNLCVLAGWQTNFSLPINVFSGPANPVIQFLAMVPVFIYFSILSLLESTALSEEDQQEEKIKEQFPMAS